MISVAAPMEARAAASLPEDGGWWFEPKWDGFRCLVLRDRGEVQLRSKAGKPLGRYFPEMMAMLAHLPARRFVLDGELLVEIGGRPTFTTLQMRLHPAASRIQRLARETPARLMLFDMLMDVDGTDLRHRSLSARRAALERFVATMGSGQLALSPGSPDRAQAEAWLGDPDMEGVVAKRLDEPYREGERAMIKVRRSRTADCVVGGFRYAAGSDRVGSLLLGLYDNDGRLNHVGFTSSLAAADKPTLTETLEALRGEGFTGDRPGGPSRWSTERSGQWVALKPALVVEVSFDHVTDGRFRHGTRLIRFRPDKAPDQCRMEQIE